MTTMTTYREEYRNLSNRLLSARQWAIYNPAGTPGYLTPVQLIDWALELVNSTSTTITSSFAHAELERVAHLHARERPE